MGLNWEQEPDLASRDPNGLNNHITSVVCEEVIGEPDSIHSIDCVWRFSYKCFHLWKNLCYLILTTLCGIFVASFWGMQFAWIAFVHIWYITPLYKIVELNVMAVRKFITVFSNCCCEPVCGACGQLFIAFKK